MHRIPRGIVCVGDMLRYWLRRFRTRFDIRRLHTLIDAVEAPCCQPETPARIALAVILQQREIWMNFYSNG